MNSHNSVKPVQEPSGVSMNNTFTIPVLQEEAQIHTLREHVGTVRVRKVVHQTEEAVNTGGYREIVETTRIPVDQVAAAVKPPWHQGDTLVIPVYEERLVTQLVLLEEIHVTRRRESFQDSVNASLRREEVIVERLNPETQQWVPEVP
jgi:stress response protein YsnF